MFFSQTCILLGEQLLSTAYARVGKEKQFSFSIYSKGAFPNYVDKFLAFFDHLPPSVYTFYLINVDKKLTFLDYLPTSSCQCSLWSKYHIVMCNNQFWIFYLNLLYFIISIYLFLNLFFSLGKPWEILVFLLQLWLWSWLTWWWKKPLLKNLKVCPCLKQTVLTIWFTCQIVGNLYGLKFVSMKCTVTFHGWNF